MTTTTTSPTRSRAAVLVACVALFTDMLVYGLAIPVLPLLPATVAAGPTATGLLFAAYAVAIVVVTPIAGRLVDRAGPRRPLLWGLVGLAAATLLFAVGAPFALLVVARALQGVAAGMAWVAGLSLIAATTTPENRGRAMGLAMSMVSVGVLVGPPVAGLLVDAVGPRAPFLLGAAVAVVDGVLRAVLVRSEPVRDGAPSGPLGVVRVRGSVSVLLAVVVAAGSLAAIDPVLPPHLTTTQGLGPLAVGALFALVVLVGAVLNPVIGGLVGRLDARLLVGTGGVLVAVALVGLALADGPVATGVALGVLGASNAALLAPATTLVGFQAMRLDPPALGASYGAFNLAYAVGLVLGPVLGGALTGAAGFATAGVVLAGLAVAGTGLALPRLPTGRG